MDRIEGDNDAKRIVQLHRPITLPLVRIALKVEALFMNSLYLYKFILLFNCTYRKNKSRIRISSKQQLRSLIYVHQHWTMAIIR